MSKADIAEQCIEPLAAAEQMEIVDVQFVVEQGKKVLRFFLDKNGGITLSDCERMSGLIGDTLEASGKFSEAYVLEVSSPGVDRVLKKEKDFVRFAGQRAKISVFAPVNGQRNFLGVIVSAANGAVTIDDESGKKVTLPLEAIARARLEPSIE
jgi:ribosome maturation factor RimP